MNISQAKKIFFTLLISLTVSGFIVICTMGQTVHRHRVETKSAAIAAAKSDVPMFTVREHEGKLAVFYRQHDMPFRVIDFDLSLLSECDRADLISGVGLESEAELKTYIQDITS